MIDIHCHILPGLDDGAQNMEDALIMASEAARLGIETIIASPHHANERYDNDADVIVRAVERLNRELERQHIPVHVLPGQEIRVHLSLLDELDSNKLLTLNESRYILLEFHRSCVPDNIEELFYELRLRGLVPVIAHPERNAEIYTDSDIAGQLVDQGALLQLTAGSLLGHFGRTIQKKSLMMCRQGLVHLIASDAHNPARGIDQLEAAYRYIEHRLGKGLADSYKHNAYCLLENRDINVVNVYHLRRRIWHLRWFSRKER